MMNCAKQLKPGGCSNVRKPLLSHPPPRPPQSPPKRRKLERSRPLADLRSIQPPAKDPVIQVKYDELSTYADGKLFLDLMHAMCEANAATTMFTPLFLLMFQNEQRNYDWFEDMVEMCFPAELEQSCPDLKLILAQLRLHTEHLSQVAMSNLQILENHFHYLAEIVNEPVQPTPTDASTQDNQTVTCTLD